MKIEKLINTTKTITILTSHPSSHNPTHAEPAHPHNPIQPLFFHCITLSNPLNREFRNPTHHLRKSSRTENQLSNPSSMLFSFMTCSWLNLNLWLSGWGTTCSNWGVWCWKVFAQAQLWFSNLLQVYPTSKR